jgi:hypothetical protein
VDGTTLIVSRGVVVGGEIILELMNQAMCGGAVRNVGVITAIS